MKPSGPNKNGHRGTQTFHRIAGALFMASLCLGLGAAASMELLSSIRAYVAGEGLWSKGQKEAVYHLSRMAATHASGYYDKYRDAIAIPLGDRQARIELERPDFDPEIARRGFLQGRNDAADIGGMIRLFRWFHGVSYMKSAIDIWAEADGYIVELAAVGDAMRAEIARQPPDAVRLDALLLRAYAINDRLTPLETAFSSTLGEASRQIKRLLLEMMIGLAAMVFVIGTASARALIGRAERLQIELGEREERFRSLFENNIDAVLVNSPGGDILEANPAASRLFGYSEAELRLAGRSAIVRPDTPGLAEALAERVRTGHFRGELEMMRKDGSRFTAEISSSIFHGPDGGERAYLIVRDVTGRKSTEKRLERLRNFNTAFRQISQAIARNPERVALFKELCGCAVRLGGLAMAGVQLIDHDTGRVTAIASEGVSQDYLDDVIISIDPESPYGHGLAGTAIRAGTNFICNDVAHSGMTVPWQKAFARAGFAASAAFPLRQHGAVIGILSLYAAETDFFDQPLVELMDQLAREVSFGLDYISAQNGREAAEEEIRSLNRELEQRVAQRTSDLEASNRALHTSNQELAAFSYSVSHDLRAPLRAINGFSALLMSEHAEGLDAQAHGYLQRLRDASLNMDQLTAGLLELAQIGRTPLNRAQVDLSAMAMQVAQELRRHEPRHEVEFVIPEGVLCNADAVLIKVVLRNLLDNAWKFSHGAAQPRIEFGVADGDGQPSYFVADNGCGLDMAYAHKLFGAFSRLHGPGEYAGTGIGLATVKRILDRHGGRVWVKAAPGEGAVFHFTVG